MAGKFSKAKPQQAFFKIGLYGATGSGKTFTALLWAEGLARREGKRIAYIDTERGTDFYATAIPDRIVHPDAFDFDTLPTKSIEEALEAVETLDTNEYGVLVIDSITHLWEAAKAAYQGRLMSTGGIPIQAWSSIKRPYKRLMSLFLDGNFHAILCGREGVVMEENEEGEPKVVGRKMKSEGETPYEPHILGRMVPERIDDNIQTINVMFEKDRSGVLMGKKFLNPNYSTIEPIVRYLTGSEQGKLGTEDENAERDAAAQEQAAERAADERKALFEQIETALNGAKNLTELKSAWDLTKGKKTKLGDDFYDKLESLKDSRKVKLVEAA